MPYKDLERFRQYQKEYHLRTWDIRKHKHREAQVKRRFLLNQWLQDYKMNLRCEKCGEDDKVCLDFHHIDSSTKYSEIATMVSEGYSKDSILLEIRKCVVLCANCHRKVHGA